MTSLSTVFLGQPKLMKPIFATSTPENSEANLILYQERPQLHGPLWDRVRLAQCRILFEVIVRETVDRIALDQGIQ
jgi:hypothetical protein